MLIRNILKKNHFFYFFYFFKSFSENLKLDILENVQN